jgi:hypothetical protein
MTLQPKTRIVDIIRAATAAGFVGTLIQKLAHGRRLLANGQTFTRTAATRTATLATAGAKTMSRAAFDRLGHAERGSFFKSGGRLTP